MGGERAAFEITDAKDMPIQAKLYWLKKRSRQFIAGGVHFTENWEDADYTHNENFKIGIDFFLSPNGKSLLVALSNRGNIRVVELQHKLNNTQVDIFKMAWCRTNIFARSTTQYAVGKLQSYKVSTKSSIPEFLIVSPNSSALKIYWSWRMQSFLLVVCSVDCYSYGFCARKA